MKKLFSTMSVLALLIGAPAAVFASETEAGEPCCHIEGCCEECGEACCDGEGACDTEGEAECDGDCCADACECCDGHEESDASEAHAGHGAHS